MKHKHYDVIMAYANGAKVEMFERTTKKWVEYDYPSFYEELEYRVKKEPKVETFCYESYSNGSIQCIGDIKHLDLKPFYLKLTFSDGELISAEVVKFQK